MTELINCFYKINISCFRGLTKNDRKPAYVHIDNWWNTTGLTTLLRHL
jgi:hypothetical protein